MRLSVVGAGSVGLLLGARLARAGHQVLLVVRRDEVARAIEAHGVALEDPVTGERGSAPAAAVVGAAACAERLAEGPVVLCTRAPDTAAAARELAEAAPAATVVSAQNDVDNDALLARGFARVLGLVVRQTCTRVGLRSVRATGAGRLVLGVFSPTPADAAARAERDLLAEALRSAGFDVGVSQRIQEDRWLKLCVNLMSAPNALVRREDHESRAFVEVKARLLEEARDALIAAGIAARSCDGRDRSLEEEIRYQRESLRLGTSARRLPLFNAVWTGLRAGGDVEADRFHRRILEVAAAGGVAAPVNARVLEVLLAASAPECVGAEELLPTPERPR